MSKFFKSRFTSGQSAESISKLKVKIEFFQVLKTFLKRPGIKLFLNVPETIVIQSTDLSPYLLYTDSDGILNIKDSINSE